VIDSPNDGLEEDGDNNVDDSTNKIEEINDVNTSGIKKIVTRNVGYSQRRKIR